ncbi:hypothetical protein C2G38_2233411 [Gigaspora rosea]|uniref:Uncharacterized protein n=1 Tax=Gigaspora rosea TaxID=44941 RepID=A0A397TZV6_9GLOM|nr:hypothetical protein C2G38_2233411 [Gigaspora rosea]
MSNNSNNPFKTSNTETTNAYNSDDIANPPNLDVNNYFDYDSSDSIESIASPSQSRQLSQSRRSYYSSPENRNRFLSPIRGRSRERSTNQNQTCRQNDRPQLNNAGYEREILKQNRYLYLLVKELRRNVKEIKDKLKWLRKEKESDLSPQVLDDIYTNVVNRLFPQNLYPSQQIIKESLKDYSQPSINATSINAIPL